MWHAPFPGARHAGRPLRDECGPFRSTPDAQGRVSRRRLRSIPDLTETIRLQVSVSNAPESIRGTADTWYRAPFFPSAAIPSIGITFPEMPEERKKPGNVGRPVIYPKKSSQRTRDVSCAATRTSCQGTAARRLCRRTASRAAATPATTQRTNSTGSVSWSASSVTDAT